MTKAGFKVTGGLRVAGDTNAPDYELVIGGGGASAFVAFYNHLARAKRYESEIRTNAERFKGAVERHGKITVVWVRAPLPGRRASIAACLF